MSSIFSEGPTKNGHNIRSVEATAAGNRVWFSGASGTFGYYDEQQRRVVSHAGPYNLTPGFESISVTGMAQGERVHAASDNGKIVRASMSGTELTVHGVSVPGDGSAMTEVVDTGHGLYAADTTGALYHSVGGKTWTRRNVASTTIVALATGSSGVYSLTDDGTVRRHHALFGGGSGQTKTLFSGVSSPNDIAAGAGTVATVGGGGTLLLRSTGTVTEVALDTNKALVGVDVLEDGTVVAVGAGGVVVTGTPTADE